MMSIGTLSSEASRRTVVAVWGESAPMLGAKKRALRPFWFSGLAVCPTLG